MALDSESVWWFGPFEPFDDVLSLKEPHWVASRTRTQLHDSRMLSARRSLVLTWASWLLAGDEIARLIAQGARTVYHTARTWPTAEVQQPRGNLHRMPWVTGLTTRGEALFAGRQALQVDSVVYCTGYQYSFPFLEGTGLVSAGMSPIGYSLSLPSAGVWLQSNFQEFAKSLSMSEGQNLLADSCQCISTAWSCTASCGCKNFGSMGSGKVLSQVTALLQRTAMCIPSTSTSSPRPLPV